MNHQNNVNGQGMDAIPDPNSVQVMSDWDHDLQFNAIMDMLPDQPAVKPEYYDEGGVDDLNKW